MFDQDEGKQMHPAVVCTGIVVMGAIIIYGMKLMMQSDSYIQRSQMKDLVREFSKNLNN